MAGTTSPAMTTLVGFLESRRVFELIEPVEAHLAHDAVADDDEPRFLSCVGVEMLVCRERRDVDEIAALPRVFLGLGFPFPFEFVEAIEFHVPMQVVARAFGDEDHLFPHMAVLAGSAAAG